MTALALEGVTHRYPGADGDALCEVGLVVPEGSMTAVVGPSGSGKSTLLRVAAGLESPSRGRVLVDGVDVAAVPTEQRDLTVMFQAPLLFDHLDVAGNVAFPARLRGVRRRPARRDAEEFLRLVHLDGFAGRRVASLSGGQQQRVALARALAARRGVLLLDEPFSSLDRELRVAMHDLLAEVRGALAPTVVMVTHDLDEAATADDVAVLVGGRVHQQAPVHLLHQRPATLEVARLLGGFGEVRGTVRAGVHHSGWGAVALAEGCEVTGGATMLLRREHLLLGPEDQHTRGTIGGQVVRRRSIGPRAVLDVAVDDGARVEVELAPGAEPPRDARVRVARTPDAPAPWAVAAGGASGLSRP